MFALHFDPITTSRDWGELVEQMPPEVALQSSESTAEDDIEALRSRVDLYVYREDWGMARRALTELVARLDAAEDQDELCRRHHTLGYVAQRLGREQEALAHYRTSFELDGTFLPTLQALAASLREGGDLEEAGLFVQIILDEHSDALDLTEHAEALYQLGELALRQGEPERAAALFQETLALDDHHVLALRGLASIAADRQDWEELFETCEALLGLLGPGDRFELLLEQAQLCSECLEDPFRAIDVYTQARSLRPLDVRVLRPLIDLYGETAQHSRRIETLSALVDAQTAPQARREAHLELARAFADAGETEEAVDSLNRALDEEPTCVDAFREIERILFDVRDWRGLAANYRRMIRRVPKSAKKARSILWRSLGQIYDKGLKSRTSAQIAYEAALAGDPDDEQLALSVADRYAAQRATAPKALEIYHRLLSTSADPEVAARRLFELYSALDQLDHAFCALGALILLRAATDTELEVYRLLLKRAPKSAAANLTDELWNDHLLHPRFSGPLKDLCAILYENAPALFDGRQQRFDLQPHEQVDLTDGGRTARARLRYFDVCASVRALLDVGEVEHYHRPLASDRPRLCPGETPVLYAGEDHEVFQAMNPSDLRWTLARELAGNRPELSPAFAISPVQLAACLEAALQLVSPEGSKVDLGLNPDLVASWREALSEQLTEDALRALEAPAQAALRESAMAGLADFLEAAEYSASRAALVAAQDALAARRGLHRIDQKTEPPRRCRIRELMLFTLSQDHFALRARLGLAIA